MLSISNRLDLISERNRLQIYIKNRRQAQLPVKALERELNRLQSRLDLDKSSKRILPNSTQNSRLTFVLFG